MIRYQTYTHRFHGLLVNFNHDRSINVLTFFSFLHIDIPIDTLYYLLSFHLSARRPELYRSNYCSYFRFLSCQYVFVCFFKTFTRSVSLKLCHCLPPHVCSLKKKTLWGTKNSSLHHMSHTYAYSGGQMVECLVHKFNIVSHT